MTERESHPERPNLPASGNALFQSNSLRSLLARWLDFLYPPACLLCRVPLQKGRYLCQSCCEDLPRIKQPYCMKCGDNIEGLVPEDVVCNHCRGVALRAQPTRSCTPTSMAGKSISTANSHCLWKSFGTIRVSPFRKTLPGLLFLCLCIGGARGGDGLINPSTSRKHSRSNANSAAKRL